MEQVGGRWGVGGGWGAHPPLRKQGEWNFTQEARVNGSALKVSVLASTLGNFIMGARFAVCVCVCMYGEGVGVGGWWGGSVSLCSPEVMCDNNFNKCDIRPTSKETQRRPWGGRTWRYGDIDERD